MAVSPGRPEYRRVLESLPAVPDGPTTSLKRSTHRGEDLVSCYRVYWEAILTTILGSCRRFILIVAVLLVGVGLVEAVGVIPLVKAAPHPLASPKAVPAFWANVILQVLVAAILVLIAVRTTGRSRLLTVALGFLAFVTIALGFVLTNAASAYWGDSPGLHRASIVLYVCAAADLVAAVLIVTIAFLLPRWAAEGPGGPVTGR
jgi:hypothetical protein